VKLSIRKRIVIFVAAAVAVHFAFYFLPRYAATRPRFDQKAYDEAVAVLKEEVGASAVDAGVITIPKGPVACPYRGEMIAVGFDPDRNSGVFLDFRGRETRLILHTGVPNEPGKPPEAGMARLEREQGRRIWDVVSYLAKASATPAPRALHSGEVPGLKLTDRTWLRARIMEFEKGDKEATFDRDAASRAAGRYVRSMLASGGFTWTSDKLEAAFVDTLHRTAPRASPDESCRANDEWLRHAESFLVSFASAKARPFFVAQIRKGRGFGGWLERAPLIGRFFRASDSAFRAGYPWVFEKLAVMSPAKQLAAVSSAAFDPNSPYKGNKYAALWFLCRNWPKEYRRLCMERFKDYSLQGGGEYLGYYKEAFPADTMLADIIAGNPNIGDDPEMLTEAYRLTKKREYIDKLMEYALRPADWKAKSAQTPGAMIASFSVKRRGRANPFDEAAGYLGMIYEDGRSITDIPEFLLKHATLARETFFFRPLAERGAPEDRQFFVSVALDEVPEYDALSKDALYELRWEAIGAFGGRRDLLDEPVVERLVAYLEGEPEPFAEESGYVQGIIGALGAVKSQRAHEFIEKIWAQDDDAYDRGGSMSYVRLYNIPRTYNGTLLKTLLLLRVRCAASPIDALLEIPSSDGDALAHQLAIALADEYSEDDLERLLAEAKYARLRGHIYGAMVVRRGMEGRK